MIWFLVFTFVFYAILIGILAIGFHNITNYISKNNEAKTSFSVIIPFRNEAKNLPLLLKSITELKYSKNLVEFILVDDASSDNSIEVINKFLSNTPNKERGEISKTQNLLPLQDFSKINISVIKNVRTSNSPKKDAITTAITIAKNNWVVTTDADCVMPKNWLKILDDFIQHKKSNMIVAPVNYKVANNFLEQFQLLDFMSMQATTIGGFGINFPFLCNGANFAYKKTTFIELNGFRGNDNIASGDDVFLFEKFIKADKKSVRYLKSQDAIVTTFPVKSWTDLMNQRTRWAAKTSSFSSLSVKLIGLLVLLTNAFVVYSICVLPFKTMFVLFMLKMGIDLLLFLPTIKFFKHQKNFYKWYILASLWYPFFSVFIVFKSLFFNYNWKGRSFKK